MTEHMDLWKESGVDSPTVGQPSPSIPRPVQLSQEIARYVRDLVMSGQLRTQQQLNIEQLARHFRTSTTPVREALLSLRGEGFVEFEPRKGFRIAALTEGDVNDLFLVQSNIAGELAARAALQATQSDLDRLDAIQKEMYKAAELGADDRIEELNFQFHRLINRVADSPKLSWLLGVVVNYVPRRFYSSIGGWPAASLKDHDAIITGLTEHDGAATRKAMTSHIQHASELLIAHLRDSRFWAPDDEDTSKGGEDDGSISVPRGGSIL